MVVGDAVVKTWKAPHCGIVLTESLAVDQKKAMGGCRGMKRTACMRRTAGTREPREGQLVGPARPRVEGRGAVQKGRV